MNTRNKCDTPTLVGNSVSVVAFRGIGHALCWCKTSNVSLSSPKPQDSCTVPKFYFPSREANVLNKIFPVHVIFEHDI